MTLDEAKSVFMQVALLGYQDSRDQFDDWTAAVMAFNRVTGLMPNDLDTDGTIRGAALVYLNSIAAYEASLAGISPVSLDGTNSKV